MTSARSRILVVGVTQRGMAAVARDSSAASFKPSPALLSMSSAAPGSVESSRAIHYRKTLEMDDNRTAAA